MCGEVKKKFTLFWNLFEKFEFPAWWERDIVLKFVPEPFKRRAHTEFENHVAMNAYQNKDIERFGIPNLNYFGSILDHRVHALGFSFFESCEEKLNMKCT